MRAILFSFLGLLAYTSLTSQMIVGTDTLYGNEWIDYDKTYFKLKLADDGIYRISYDDLTAMGFPVEEASGAQLQIFSLGNEIPLHVSNTGSLTNGDYIEFVGKRNRGELDKHLYINGEEDQLNPEYSLFSDTSAYFLSYHQDPVGLRYEENPIGNSNNPLEFYIHEELKYFSTFHHKPTYNGNDQVQYSHFDVSEGFGSQLQKETEVALTTNGVVETPQFQPKATIRFGSNPNGHEAQISFNGTVKATENFFGFDAKEIEMDLSYDEIQSNNEIKLLGTVSEFDKYTVALAKLTYPRSTAFGGDYFEFIVEANPFEKYYEFFFPGGSYYIYDLENNHRTEGVAENGKLKFAVAPGNNDRKIIVASTASTKQVASATQKNYVDHSTANPNFLFLTSSKLYDPNDTNNAVKAYADYRSSDAGGGFDTYIVTAEDLLDQFAYGIDRHNIGNRNFAFYVQDKWNLKFWYNVGKGIQYSGIRFADNTSQILNDAFHVPTFGAPGSDVMMLSEKDQAYPIYSLGRIAIKSEEQLLAYLAKVIEHDNKASWDHTYESRYWLKRILHLSGGDTDLQETIFNALEAMRNEIERNKFGGDVTTLRKFNSTTIDESLADAAANLIDEGVSVITFFGHSSPGTFDFNLEDPSQFGNYGKYPFIISLGCYSGNIHTTSTGLSENFVVEPEKAAIAMLASSGTAYVSPQAVGGYDLYQRFGGEFYTQTLSEAIRSIQLKNINVSTISQRTLMQQLNYHGDPALRLTDMENLDVTFDKSTVRTNPEIINPLLDSFEVTVDLVNLNTPTTDTFGVKFIHYDPKGAVFQEKTIRTTVPNNRNQISTTLAVPGIESLGKNSLEIIIDYLDELDETPSPDAINNNSLSFLTDDVGYCFYVLDNGIRPVSPSNFAILNDNCPFELKASTNNAMLAEAKYLFEIDTTESFNSPIVERADVVSKGGILSYVPSIEKVEDQVYYWRVSPDSLTTGIGLIWNNSSFVYRAQSEYGWNQSHYYQFKKNERKLLEISDETRQFVFNREIIGYRFDLSSLSPTDLRFFVNNSAWSALNPIGNSGPCSTTSSFLGVHVRHPEQYILTNQTGTDHGSFTCNGNILFGYYMNDLNDCENLIGLLESFPENTRIFIYTYLVGDTPDLNTEIWDDNIPSMGMSLIDYLNNQGATQINNVINDGTVPYVLVFDKGDEGIVLEEIREHHTDELIQNSEAFKTRKEGSMFSVKIGKGNFWNRLLWKPILEDSDDAYVNVYGEKSDGTLDTIFTEVRDEEFSLDDLNELSFENMHFEIFASDQSKRTAPQIEYFQILYTPVPDVALNTGSADYTFVADTLEQGSLLQIDIPLENYTAFDFGAAEMEFSLFSETNQTVIDTIDIAAIASKTSGMGSWTYDTKDLNGKYLLSAVYNPQKNPSEQTFGNNFGIREFYVAEDKTNPLLEMTFDGVDILDGDIVSCSPEIQISLTDNNQFLLLDDPSLFDVTLTYPNNSDEMLDPATDPNIFFEEASGTNGNKAKIIYTPTLVEEGFYTITVNAKDKSGNSSGNTGISRRFEVIKDSRISNVFNYPNPFSTSTQFVFTVTGDAPPINLHLNIYSLSGKLVKQILPEELGPIRIGTNRTEFKWDGTDEFGSKLANGTYLYKVKYDDPNGEFESYNTSADDMFINGFGKMVIMR